jgi:hypothetical protein
MEKDFEDKLDKAAEELSEKLFEAYSTCNDVKKIFPTIEKFLKDDKAGFRIKALILFVLMDFEKRNKIVFKEIKDKFMN